MTLYASSNQSNSRVLVTGANGFIGSALVRRLVARGVEVHCLIHRNRDRLAGLPVRTFEGTVTRHETLQPALTGVDHVYHLGALASDWGPTGRFFQVNTEGTRNLIETAITAGVRRFVHMSSLAVHRFSGHVDADENTPADQDRYAYAASKVGAEKLVLKAHRDGRIETSIVRPGVVVYGPEDTTAFVHMAPMLQRGRWIHVAGGRPWMCSVYVENLVDGMLLLGTSPQAQGEIFNITDDLKLTWEAYIQTIIAAFGARKRTISVPAALVRPLGLGMDALYRLFRSSQPPPINDYRTALVSRDFHFTCEKAKSLLGYEPHVSLEKGVAEMVAWYQDRDANPQERDQP